MDTLLAQDPIDALIEAARFDEDDVDAATSGFCPTFALALHRVLLDRGVVGELCFLSCVNRRGQPDMLPGNLPSLCWRHVVVRVGDALYDIQGRVCLNDIIENYCWGHISPGGVLIAVNLREFRQILRETRRAYDGRSYAKWKIMLQETSR